MRAGHGPHARLKQRGNVFAMLFGAVALTGVLAAVGMQTLTGPVTTITRVTQRNVAETNLLMSAKIVVNAAVTGLSGGDADDDGIIEPAPFTAAGGSDAPTNGGFLPTNLGLNLTDPWGTRFGYCVWDHGTTNSSTGRITGDVTAGAEIQPVIAIVTAGPDKSFQTTCSPYAGGNVDATKTGGSDDIMFKFTYAEATASSNGLWTLNTSNDAKAELKDSSGASVNVAINRDTGIGDFLGVTTSTLAAKLDLIAIDGGLQLDDEFGVPDCIDAGDAGVVRYNSVDGKMEICDGLAWGAAGSAKPAGSTGEIQFNDGAGALGADSNLFWDNTNKRLGLGTAAPTEVVHVQGSTSGNVSIRVANSGTGPARLRLVGNNGAEDFVLYTAQDRLSVWDASGGGEVLTIQEGGNVGIGTAAPDASALLDLSSESKGFLPPRMTEEQRNAIAGPATGLLIFNETASHHEFWNGSTWATLGGGVPSGIIAAFAATSCPTGWTEYAPARGRFLRGIDTTGSTTIDPDGSRAPGNTQGDAAPNITGSIDGGTARPILLGASGAFALSGASGAAFQAGGGTRRAGASFNASRSSNKYGAANEIRPKNVAVLFCQYAGGAPLVATPSGALGAIQLSDGSGGLASDANIVVTGGKVGIGTTAPHQNLHVAGQSVFDSTIYLADGNGSDSKTAGMLSWDDLLYFQRHTDNTYAFEGNIATINLNTGAYTQLSDARLKDHVRPIENALATVRQLRGVSYDWRADRRIHDFGLIAQEVETILPELVRVADDDTQTKMLSYDGFIPFLVEAIKELAAANDILKAENVNLRGELRDTIASQDSQVETLRRKVEALESAPSLVHAGLICGEAPTAQLDAELLHSSTQQ